MRYLLTSIIALFLIISCKSGENSSGNSQNREDKLMPSWLEKIIEENNYENVSSYLFRSDTVYLLVPPCCDRFSELYNQEGDLICHPSGGITGRGDGTCPEFQQEASQLRTFVKNHSSVDE